MTLREILQDAFSLKDDTATHEDIRARLVDGGRVTGANMCVLMLAIFIASIGLNMNSTAVIIGAMLISPLMGTIQAMAYGIASADLQLFRRSLLGLFFQVAVSLVASTLYFAISPISTATSELLARTQPTIWDVLIALFGGLAGIIGVTRVEKSNIIPGVAIATALMPPLCTCGYGLANGQWQFLLGAGYLFCVNAYFILFASTMVLSILQVPRKRVDLSSAQRQAIKRRLIISTLIVTLPSLLVAYHMVQTAGEDREAVVGFEQARAEQAQADAQLKAMFPEVEESSLQRVEDATSGNAQENRLELEVTLRTTMDERSEARLIAWAQTIYGEDVHVVFALDDAQ